MQDRRRRTRQVGHDVVPVSGDVAFVEGVLDGIGHGAPPGLVAHELVPSINIMKF
jgi:hypothetical protein